MFLLKQVEEEEYTSRIIHYFGVGLLTLPEGATMRSYLADKLNCDPMRITKKYAGASCLGRRVHQFRDRRTPTITEIQLAKAELDHLEQRFRMRVEEGYSLPLATPYAIPQQANPFLFNPAVSTIPSSSTGLPPWLMGMVNQQQQQSQAPASSQGFSQPVQALSAASNQFSGLAGLGAAAPWLVPGAASAPPPSPYVAHFSYWYFCVDTCLAPLLTILFVSIFCRPSAGAPGFPHAAMANWAFAQAAASLAPAITQLAAANLQQQRRLHEAKNPAPVDPLKELAARLKESMDTKALRDALQAAMAGNNPVPPPPPVASTSALESLRASLLEATAQAPMNRAPAAAQPLKRKEPSPPAAPLAPPAGNATAPKPRTEEDKQAGDMLLGFLSSLRHSYEDAVKGKSPQRSNNNQTLTSLRDAVNSANRAYDIAAVKSGSSTSPQSNNQRLLPTQSLRDAVNNANRQNGRPPQVSESSMGQQESSIDESDWNSDKKTETSSSEDSDKEPNRVVGKGPPRKRMKTKRAADERERHAASRNS
jgi:hypothetical protein